MALTADALECEEDDSDDAALGEALTRAFAIEELQDNCTSDLEWVEDAALGEPLRTGNEETWEEEKHAEASLELEEDATGMQEAHGCHAHAVSEHASGSEDVELDGVDNVDASLEASALVTGEQEAHSSHPVTLGGHVPVRSSVTFEEAAPKAALRLAVGAAGGGSAGYVFLCSHTTQRKCESLRVFGAPLKSLQLMRQCIMQKTSLFLFKFESRKMVGVFNAVGEPGEDLVPGAFGSRWTAHVRVAPREHQVIREVILDQALRLRMRAGPQAAVLVDTWLAQLDLGTPLDFNSKVSQLPRSSRPLSTTSGFERDCTELLPSKRPHLECASAAALEICSSEEESISKDAAKATSNAEVAEAERRGLWAMCLVEQAILRCQKRCAAEAGRFDAAQRARALEPASATRVELAAEDFLKRRVSGDHAIELIELERRRHRAVGAEDFDLAEWCLKRRRLLEPMTAVLGGPQRPAGKELEMVRAQKRQAVQAERYALAARLKTREQQLMSSVGCDVDTLRREGAGNALEAAIKLLENAGPQALLEACDHDVALACRDCAPAPGAELQLRRAVAAELVGQLAALRGGLR